MLMNTISLRIYGGSQSVGLNPQPIVSVGTLPEGFRPSLPTIVNEQQSWMITHAQAYTAYALVLRDCRTADGQPGVMLMVLFLPPQQRLAGEKTPFSLLNSLHDFIAVNHMPDNRLPDAPVDSTPYQTLLQRYLLEERPTLLPIMTGVEPAAFCAEGLSQVEALMRYSRYTLLSDVGRLEIGLHCPTTVQIPIKGKAQPKPKSDTDEQPRKEQPKQEKPEEKEIDYNIVVEWKGADEEDYTYVKHLMKTNKSRLMLIGQDITRLAYTNQKATIPASKTRHLHAVIFPKTVGVYAIGAETKINDNTHVVSIIISFSQPKQEQPQQTVHQPNTDKNNGKSWLRTLRNLSLIFIGIFTCAIIYFFTRSTEGKPIEDTTTTEIEIPKGNNELPTKNYKPQETSTVTPDETATAAQAQAEAEAAARAKAEKEAKEKADKDRAEKEKLAKQKEQEVQKKADAEKAKAEIINIIKKGANISIIKKHPAFGQLTQAEAMDVEWYVDFYDLIEKKPYEIKKRKKQLKSWIYPNGINSWEDLRRGRLSIPRAVNELKASEL